MATDEIHMEDQNQVLTEELSWPMQLKQHVHDKFLILPLKDPSKANAWRLKAFLAIDISLTKA